MLHHLQGWDWLNLPCVQKAPPLYTTDDHLKQFGLSANEIVKTPLGVKGTVLGVKYATTEQAAAMNGGKLWVAYDTGLEAPVEWEPAHGYGRCSTAEHIRRDMAAYVAELERLATERKAQEERARLQALGIEPAGSTKASSGTDRGSKPKKKKK
jgi:hypothetical protein